MQGVTTSDLWRAFTPLRLAGPIFDKELRVASRRGRTYLLRLAYIGVLLFFVLSAWGTAVKSHAAAPSSVVVASRMGQAAITIVGAITWVQFLACQLLAVVLLSGAIGDEIRKRSLDALLVAPISSFQIVLGKLFGQLLQLILLLAVSLPLLAVVRVFGGVPWNYVVSSLCVTLTAALVVGSLSLFLSIADRNARTVVGSTLTWCVVAWGLVPALFTAVRHAGHVGSQTGQAVLYLTNPFYVLASLSATMTSPGARAAARLGGWPLHCLVMLGVAVILLSLSMRRVRRVALAPVAGGSESAPQGASVPSRWSHRAIRRIKGSPIVWRELKWPILPRGRRGRVRMVLLLIAGGGTLVALIYMFIRVPDSLPAVCMVFAFALAVAFVFSVASAAASAITKEKEGRSLQILLTIPCEDGKIVRDKAIGILRRNLPLLVPVPLLGLLAYALTPSRPDPSMVVVGVLWFTAGLVGHTALLMGLGFCMSAYLKTTAAATALTLALFFGFKLLGFMIFTPILAIVMPAAHTSPWTGLVFYAGVQAAVYVGVAWVLGCVACAQLRPGCQK